jgi:hypothetical protein
MFVVFQEASEPFTTLHWALTLAAMAAGRKEQVIAFALMIPLVLVMVHVLVQHVPQGAFTKQNDP